MCQCVTGEGQKGHKRQRLHKRRRTKVKTVLICRQKKTHRAAILADAVCEAAVALSSDLDVIGALEKQSLLQVAGGGVHVGDAVLAVVCDVLRGLVGHQAHEGHLDADVLRISSLTAVLELYEGERRLHGRYITDQTPRLMRMMSVHFFASYLESTGHGLAEPDVLLVSDVLAEVPVLHGDAGIAWVDASLASLHVAVDLDGIQRRSLVGVNPVGA